MPGVILSGAKRYEFRKCIFSNRHVENAYIYETSPTKKIVGVFDIGDIIRARPNDLWDQFGHLSGMNEAEFFDYFQDIQIGFAIEIKHVVIFDAPIDPKEQISGFTPPQSFCYLKYSLVPECVTIKGYIDSRISCSGLTLHDRRSVERSLSADRSALRECQPAPGGSLQMSVWQTGRHTLPRPSSRPARAWAGCRRPGEMSCISCLSLTLSISPWT